MKKGNLIERSQLNKINSTEKIINEANWLAKLAKLILKPTVGRKLKQIAKKLHDDPEFQSAVISYQQAADHADELFKSYCERNPWSKMCKQRKKYGRRY